MAQKMSSVNKLSQGSSLQVMEKDREWKEKFDSQEKTYSQRNAELEKQLNQTESEISIIKKNYESQLTMMSD